MNLQLSYTSKMPGASLDLPAAACRTGGAIRQAGRDRIAALPARQRKTLAAGVQALLDDGQSVGPCTLCYALKGNYGRPNVKRVLEGNLDAVRAALESDDAADRFVADAVALFRVDGGDEQRLFASGDLQSAGHLGLLVRVAQALPGVRFWLPTQERRYVRDWCASQGIGSVLEVAPNLNVRVSAPIIGHATPDVISSYVALHAPDDGTHVCPATLPESDGACGDCRACWAPEVPVVAYLAH